MIEEDRTSRIAPDAAAVATMPVRRPRGRLGAVALGAAVVAVAFAGGVLVASPGQRDTLRLPAPTEPGEGAPAVATSGEPTGGAPASAPGVAGIAPPGPAASPAPMPSGAARPWETAPPGSSMFVTTFDPASVVVAIAGGQACEIGPALEKQAPRTRLDGPRLTYQRSWLVHCLIPQAEQQAFLIRMFRDLSRRIPAETFSYGTTLEGSGSALYPYAERPMAGTVALHAGPAGGGLAIVLVIEEWRTG